MGSLLKIYLTQSLLLRPPAHFAGGGARPPRFRQAGH